MKKFEQAIQAFEVYCKRGEEAARLIQKGDLDRFEEVMNNRQKAFLNFKALDYAATHAGFDLSKSPTAQKLHQKNLMIQNKIEQYIQGHQSELLGTLHKQSHSLRVSLSYLSKSASNIVKFFRFV